MCVYLRRSSGILCDAAVGAEQRDGCAVVGGTACSDGYPLASSASVMLLIVAVRSVYV